MSTIHKPAFFFLLLLSTVFSTSHAQLKHKKVVFLIVDGIPADVIESQPHPHLRRIQKAGGYTRAYVGGRKGTYSETPTISAVGYNSILTGTWVNKHHVWGNDIKAPNYHYPTIFRYFKEQYPHGKTALFSSWEDNRTKLVGDRLPATGNIGIDFSYDGLELDTFHFPHDRERDFMNRIDDSVTAHAAECIRTNAPDLTWVYLEYTDDMGHKYGDDPPFYRAVQLADERIGKIYDAVRYRQKHFKEDWLIIVTTDHGRDSVTGQDHGGQSDRERSGWIFTNTAQPNQEFQAPYCSIVDIAPTINRFLQVKIPYANATEIDGYPFIGPLSFIDFKAAKEKGQVSLSWKALGKGKAEIRIANGNFSQNGGKDEYRLWKTVELKNESASIPVSELTAGINKIILVADNNSANQWVINP